MPGGRPPKPTALKLLHGNPGKRALNPDEPTPAVLADAQPPAWLKGRGRRAWRDLVGVLAGMRVLTVADQVALALLCDAYGEYIEVREAVRRHGAVYESRVPRAHSRRADTSASLSAGADDDEDFDPAALSVMIRPRPEVAMAADAWRRVNAMLQQFGLTPASRAKVSGQGGDDEDPFERFLRGI